MSQARKILVQSNHISMGDHVFTQYQLDETVKAVISVTDEDRSNIKNWTFNQENRILNVPGQHNLVYAIIEK